MIARRWRVGLLALAVVTIVLSLVGIYDQRAAARRLCHYEEAFAAQSNARSALSAEQTEAISAVLLGTGAALRPPAKATPAQLAASAAFRSLFTTYRQRSEEIKAEKLAHPLPTLPDGCR